MSDSLRLNGEQWDQLGWLSRVFNEAGVAGGLLIGANVEVTLDGPNATPVLTKTGDSSLRVSLDGSYQVQIERDKS